VTGPEHVEAECLDGVWLMLMVGGTGWESARQMAEHLCWAGGEPISMSPHGLSGGRSDWQSLIAV
jgi:hypothetical protein